jgi:hypothetical protein
MSNNINDLRAHLFDALKGLKDGTMDVGRAKAMSEIAQTIVNSAKVELEFIEATGSKDSEFLGGEKAGDMLPSGITSTTVHRIR